MKKIILIEDDPSVYKLVSESIEDWYGRDNVEVTNLEFEKAADNFLDTGSSGNVAAIVVDLMITYHPDETVEIPPQVLREGSFEAGFRLIDRIRESSVWKRVPIIVYSSVFEKAIHERLEELGLTDIAVIQKSDSTNPLMETIRSATGLKKIRR